MKRITVIVLICSSFLLAKGTNSMSKKSYEILTESQKLLEQNKDDQAKKKLLALLKTKLNSYEKAFVYQTLANIEINVNNYKGAIKYYEYILKLSSLEQKSIDNIKLSLAKIYLFESRFKESISLLNELQNSKTISTSELYENLAYAYYHNHEYKQSVIYIQKSFENTKQRKESSYQILYSSYVELKKYQKAISTLKIMVTKWHKKENYWLQLIALYQETKELAKALSTFELAYKKAGVNPKKNTLHFVNILIQNELYYKAAKTIEKAINKGYIEHTQKNFDLLISCYDYSKQKDKVKELLQNSKFGEHSKYRLLLANIHFNEQEYNKAIKTLENTLIKKGSKEDGQKSTLLALSYYQLNDKNRSAKYLSEAIKNPYEKRRALNLKKSLQI